MENIEKIKISRHASIKQALKALSKGRIKIVIVVDHKDKFIGTLTDGDIRRGFLKGLTLESSINLIFNKKPYFMNSNYDQKILIKNAKQKDINQIPIIDNKGKVEKIILVNKILNNTESLNKVVIMAGGKGTRLRPLTKHIPKPMLKVGKKPILQNLIEKFKLSGFRNFLISVNYKSKIIKNYFEDGNKFGVKIEYIEEKTRMGTAGSLSLIKKRITKPFFIVNGDLMIDLDFRKMMDYHTNNRSMATMAIKEYKINSLFGEVKIKNEKIISIREKPEYKQHINAGLYILDPKCINLVPKKFYDMTTLLKKIIYKRFKIISFPLNEHWLDIGNVEDYNVAVKQHKKYF